MTSFITKLASLSMLIGMGLGACSSSATSNLPPIPNPPIIAGIIDPIPQNADGQKFQQITQQAITENWSQRSWPQQLQTIAQTFLGSAYQAGLLDQSATETLVASLTKFDCVLFVETVIALAKGIAVADYTYPTFTHNLVNQRYRQGSMGDYCDRLHYFSDWIADNEQRGNVVNLTPALGGIPLNKTLKFMTRHRGSYPQLANNDPNFQCITQVEQTLRQRHLTYLPTAKIGNVYSQLQSGDIIAIATKIDGLDVTHTGLVYREGNQVGLIHASPAGQVTIAPDLQRYVSKVPQAIGIIAARPLAPRP